MAAILVLAGMAASLLLVRRAFLLLGLCAAFAAPASAAATGFPLAQVAHLRPHGPRVRPGTIHLQPAHVRVRVIASLSLPPLAQRYGRGLYAFGGRRKLAIHSSTARAYVAELTAAQARAVQELRAEIPQARVQERFQVLLDAVTVSLPDTSLPKLMGMRTFSRIYPVLQYTMADDTSPSVIGAPQVEQSLGADGHGMKIAVVDDGIDQTNPFFNPSGYSYPAGFPLGNTKYTSAKVIVAKSFPGPGSGKAGKLPLDPIDSFHGTHVAGIAAGEEGTTAPAGADHPRVTGLRGVAPKAWLGNYRVFTIPTPDGDSADTPEIVAAFEAAVKDGMDVINFSGGGPEVEPQNDALIAAVKSVTDAGVVPVIAAGNDRGDVGDGSVGSPGTAPAAITVAATSNTHVFAPALDATSPSAPPDLQGIPFQWGYGSSKPAAWLSKPQIVIDVGSITGTDGKPVNPLLCGRGKNIASTKGTLPAHSLSGKIALASRGICPLETKALQAKAAGAIGLILADNRPGEANLIPVPLGLPAGMISDLDAARLRSFADGTNGQTTITVGRAIQDLNTGRSGIITSFSSSGPTDFTHDLKPDVSAPGAQVLSSTLPLTDKSRFIVLDGTSMATPHVAGAAALLLELHPTWTPAEVKSALVSTANAAWADTARTQEAPVPDEGGGLVWLPRATNPLLFTQPASLSFENVTPGSATVQKPLLMQISDAGGGSGNWSVTVVAQAATAGASVATPGNITVAPGGTVDFPIAAVVTPSAVQGENYGFVELQQGTQTRRIPYLFFVDRPALAGVPVKPLHGLVTGDTSKGTSRVAEYMWPTAPFGVDPGVPPMDEDGAEQVYAIDVKKPAANVGVSVILQDGYVDPFFLSARDESSVQGYAGTPVDVNGLTFDWGLPISAAGDEFPRVQRYYAAVDSGRDVLTGQSYAGPYILKSWVNDVTPPTLRVLTNTVTEGRPTIVVKTLDRQSGVDPYSIVIGYHGVLVAPAEYDPISGIAIIPLPSAAPLLRPGRRLVLSASSDFQESKNIDTMGSNLLPNTRTIASKLHVMKKPTVSLLLPSSGTCVNRGDDLLVDAGSPDGIKRVRFLLDGHKFSKALRGPVHLWEGLVGKVPAGSHVLSAVAISQRGHTVTARMRVRACKKK
jgi:subtilisin family serine protease